VEAEVRGFELFRLRISSSLSIRNAHLLRRELLTTLLIYDCICTERESYREGNLNVAGRKSRAPRPLDARSLRSVVSVLTISSAFVVALRVEG
jgi:hypothetical protein